MNKFGAITIGALIGGGLGYLIGDYVAVNYMGDNTEYDLEELEELLPEEFVVTKKNKIILKRNEEKVENNKKKIKDYTQHFISQDRPDLAALAAKYNGDKEETEAISQVIMASEGSVSILDEEDDNIVDKLLADGYTDSEIDFTVDEKDPAIISVAEYANDDEYDHITLNYYDDDVVTDEDDKPINRPETFLGEDALVSFGILSQDEDVVYVRNHTKKAMYEVVRTNKSYAAPVNPRRQALSRRSEEKRNEESDN